MISLDIGKKEDSEEYNLAEKVKKLAENVSVLTNQIDALNREFPYVLREKLSDEAWIKAEQEDADKQLETYKTEIEKYKQYVILLEEWKPA